MENLILSANAVLPIFLTVALGYFLNHIKLLSDETANCCNKLVFKVFLPVLIFINIYNSDPKNTINFKLLLFVVGITLFICGTLCIIIPIIEKENTKRSVMIQGIYRSNYALFGLPLAGALYGDEGTQTASFLIAAVIPVFNILAVIILESYRGQKSNIGKILIGIIKNPLIIASFLGIAAVLTGINLPGFAEKTLGSISGIATPLSLIVLGASFKFPQVAEYIKQLFISVSGRLLFTPVIGLSIAVLLGFRNKELVALISMLASPTAVSTFAMAKQMEADDTLAGQIVVFTSMLSVFSIFIIIFTVKQLNFI